MDAAPERLPARLKRDGEILVVEIVRDRMDAACTPTLRKQLALPLSRARNVVMDLSKVGFLDSAGVGLLLWIRGRQQARCGALHLCGLGARARTTLQLVRAEAVLPAYADVETARQAFTAAA